MPVSVWNDNKEKIQSALNISIDRVEQGKNNQLIVVYAVDGCYQLPDMIEWSDKFLSHLEDLYTDYSETVDRLIEQNKIETSERDSEGRYRYISGTGFYQDKPVWLCLGNVNVYTLKYFIYDAERSRKTHYIFCKERDLNATTEIAEMVNLRVGLIR